MMMMIIILLILQLLLLLLIILFLCLQSCVAAFLDVVIGGRAVETPPMSSMNLLEGLNRTAVYMTHNQLFVLVRSFAVIVKMY